MANAVFIIISILIIAFSGEHLPINIVQYREEVAVDSATLKKVLVMPCTNLSRSSFYFFPIIVRDECYPYFTCLHRCSPTHLRVPGDYSSRDCSTLVLLVQLLQRRGGKLSPMAFWSYPQRYSLQVYYKALYEAIGKLEDVDESSGIELNSSKQHQVVSLLVKREVDAAEEAYRFAHRAIQLLQMFASDIGIDEGNAQREDRNFDSQVVDNKGTSGRLGSETTISLSLQVEFKKQIENIRDLRRQIDAQETAYSQV